ncbi:MAG TPA: GGDEF domain-containing protein, partial [Rhodoferax sp.]|nr:GGDEF domain-containing protein [Rhodoferax sp.]
AGHANAHGAGDAALLPRGGGVLQGSITSTVSIGVASTTASENRDFDYLYSHADKALYNAKEKGRNRVI